MFVISNCVCLLHDACDLSDNVYHTRDQLFEVKSTVSLSFGEWLPLILMRQPNIIKQSQLNVNVSV